MGLSSRVSFQMNDPWSPQPVSNMTVIPAPVDPLHNTISPERYLDSLEKKLARIKGSSKREPTSRDIVHSLGKFRDDQMERFLRGEQNQSSVAPPESNLDGASASSYLQRRLYPEKQAMTGEELLVLLQDDALSRRIQEEQELEEFKSSQAAAVEMQIGQPSESEAKEENCKPHDTPAEKAEQDGNS